MKYEKFEEWMLHVPVVTSNGDKGEITNSLVYDRAIVLLQNGTEVVSRICNLEFLEEKPSEEPSQIDWQVGQVVWDTVRGKGEVTRVDESFYYPVGVEFDNGDTEDYTLCGEIHEQAKRSLFFSEPVITAELFPPKKPFKPTLKEGECVLLWLRKECAPVFVTIIEEKEDKLFYMHTNGQKDYTSKDGIKVVRLGEEIKFQ